MPPPSRSLAGLGGDFAFTNLRLALARFRFVGVETGGFHRSGHASQSRLVLLANSVGCCPCGTFFFVALLFAPLSWRLGRKSPARHHVGVTNEGVTPSPSDC